MKRLIFMGKSSLTFIKTFEANWLPMLWTFFNLIELRDKLGWPDYVIKTYMAAEKRSIWEWTIQRTFSFSGKIV